MSRQKVFLGGKINASQYLEPFECVIRNITLDGARISVAGNAKLPARFQLSIPAKDCLLRARTIWRDGANAGVYFDGFDFGSLEPGSIVSEEAKARWRN